MKFTGVLDQWLVQWKWLSIDFVTQKFFAVPHVNYLTCRSQAAPTVNPWGLLPFSNPRWAASWRNTPLLLRNIIYDHLLSVWIGRNKWVNLKLLCTDVVLRSFFLSKWLAMFMAAILAQDPCLTDLVNFWSGPGRGLDPRSVQLIPPFHSTVACHGSVACPFGLWSPRPPWRS